MRDDLIIAVLLKKAIEELKNAEVHEAELDARLLLCYTLHCSRVELLARQEEEISQTDSEIFQTLIQRRKAREPIAMILGKKEFWSMPFRTTGHTLDPRPDSETLVDMVLQHFPKRSEVHEVLDMGVGTGCLLLSVLSEYPLANGVGVDISRDALDIAEENAWSLALHDRVSFQLSDWGSMIMERYGCPSYDIILCNPPYIPTGDIDSLAPEVWKYDPLVALDGGEDGLQDYQQILPQLPLLLSPHGRAFLEIGQGQFESVCNIAESSGLTFERYQKDISGIIRGLQFRMA